MSSSPVQEIETREQAGEGFRPSGAGVRRLPNGQFPKGVSGNPGGKPQDKVSLTTVLLARLRAYPKELQELAEATIANAKAGNAVALKQVCDRLDGTVTERSETLLKRAEESEMD